MPPLRSACALFVVLVAAGCASRTPPETAPPPQPTVTPPVRGAEAPSAPRFHTVQPGDTLWSLARRYGVSVDDFMRANDLADPDRLDVGESLTIPAKARRVGGVWPVSGGVVSSGFGARRGGDVHRGVDIDAAYGQQVMAAWGGVVVYAGDDMSDYGKAVIIDHGAGLTSLYGHNSEVLVREGETVVAGQPIALAGQSGNATGVHCHFEVRRNTVAVNPLELLPGSSR